jgi:hypothetical protein
MRACLSSACRVSQTETSTEIAPNGYLGESPYWRIPLKAWPRKVDRPLRRAMLKPLRRQARKYINN